MYILDEINSLSFVHQLIFRWAQHIKRSHQQRFHKQENPKIQWSNLMLMWTHLPFHRPMIKIITRWVSKHFCCSNLRTDRKYEHRWANSAIHCKISIVVASLKFHIIGKHTQILPGISGCPWRCCNPCWSGWMVGGPAGSGCATCLPGGGACCSCRRGRNGNTSGIICIYGYLASISFWACSENLPNSIQS